MDTRQARYLVILAEELSFTRAAQRCNVSQPPLSRAIAQIESEVGAQLFLRDTHHVSLTAAGHSLVRDARRALEALDSGIASARRIAQGLEGSLTIGFGGSIVYALLPAMIRHFRRLAPHVAVNYRPIPIIQHIDAIRDGTIDIGIVVLPIHDELIATQTILAEPRGLALPNEHPLIKSKRKFAIVDELAKDVFVVYAPARGFNYHSDLITLCRMAGFDPQIGHEAPTTEALIGIVACGEGVAIVPASAQHLQVRGVSYLPLRAGKAPRQLTTSHTGFAWHKNRLSPVGQEFLRRAKELNFKNLAKSFSHYTSAPF